MDESILNDLLDGHLPIRIRPIGLSMHPFIRKGDFVTITPLSLNNQDTPGNELSPPTQSRSGDLSPPRKIVYFGEVATGGSLKAAATNIAAIPREQDRPKNKITPGDCVIFRDSPERWLIHRVIRTNKKNRKIIAKGDALLHPDPPVTTEIIRGKITMIHRVNSGKEYLLDRPLYRIICHLIALLSRGEGTISSFLRIQRRKVELSPGFEFVTRVIKFPKWLLTRVFFP